LTADPYKGLALTYNILNRTDKITVATATNRFLTYTYDAGGTLLRRQQFDNNVLQTTTDYSEGYVFTTTGTGTTGLAYFGMPEGRMRNNGGTLKPEYVISDQQGNARISFEDNGSGVAVVRQESSYYAFGLTMQAARLVCLLHQTKICIMEGANGKTIMLTCHIFSERFTAIMTPLWEGSQVSTPWLKPVKV
jgi:hypothetical protein